jgi:hypothetical protein
MMVILALHLFGALPWVMGQGLKDDTEKERAKRALESPAGAAKDEPATRVEKFLARKNVLLIKESYTIGSLPAQQGAEVKIEALVLSATSEAAKVYGLSVTRFSNRAGERQSLPEGVGFIDFDEVTALQTALDAIVKAAEQTSEAANGGRSSEATAQANGEGAASGPATEYALTTRGGLTFGMLQLGRQQTAFLRLNLEAQDATAFFGIGALGRLRTLIAQSRSRLLSLGAR